MELGTAGRMGGAKLLRIVVISLGVFGGASAAAAVGYPEWTWVFVFAGLVVPPVVVILAVAAALLSRPSRA